MWKVGNGEKISVCGDRWLPIPSTYHVQSPVKVLHSKAKVKELIERDTRVWNFELLYQIFIEKEVEIICSISLNLFGAADKRT